MAAVVSRHSIGRGGSDCEREHVSNRQPVQTVIHTIILDLEMVETADESNAA